MWPVGGMPGGGLDAPIACPPTVTTATVVPRAIRRRSGSLILQGSSARRRARNMTRSGDLELTGGTTVPGTVVPPVRARSPAPLGSSCPAPRCAGKQPPRLLPRSAHDLVDRFSRIGRHLRPLPCDPRHQVDDRPLTNLSLCHCRPPMDLIVGDGCMGSVAS